MDDAKSNSIVFRVLDWINLFAVVYMVIVGLISISYYVIVTVQGFPASLPLFFYAGIPLAYLCALVHYIIHEFCLIPMNDEPDSYEV